MNVLSWAVIADLGFLEITEIACGIVVGLPFEDNMEISICPGCSTAAHLLVGEACELLHTVFLRNALIPCSRD